MGWGWGGVEWDGVGGAVHLTDRRLIVRLYGEAGRGDAAVYGGGSCSRRYGVLSSGSRGYGALSSCSRGFGVRISLLSISWFRRTGKPESTSSMT